MFKTDECYIEWQRVVQRMTKNDNEWQQMTTSDSEWYNEWQRVIQRVITNDNEWQQVVKGMKTNENECEQVKESDFGFGKKQNMQFVTTKYSRI